MSIASHILPWIFLALVDTALASDPPSQGLPGSPLIEAQLRTALRDTFGLSEDIEFLEVLGFTGPIHCFASKRRITLNKNGLRSDFASKAGAAPLPDRYTWSGSSKDADSRLETPLRIQFRLRASLHRLVLRRSAQAGEVLGQELISFARVPWRLNESSTQKESYQIEDFLGRQLNKSLKRGTVLVPGMTAEAAVVRAGEVVSFVSKGTRVSIGTEAIAGQSGKLGDWIFLRRLDSGLRLRGVVGGAGLVYSQSTLDLAHARSAR